MFAVTLCSFSLTLVDTLDSLAVSVIAVCLPPTRNTKRTAAVLSLPERRPRDVTALTATPGWVLSRCRLQLLGQDEEFLRATQLVIDNVKVGTHSHPNFLWCIVGIHP